MEMIKTKTKIDFVGQRGFALLFSIVLLSISIGSMIVQGFNLGLDFSGGILIQLEFSKTADLKTIRTTLENEGIDDAVVQNFGSTKEVVIRLAPKEEESDSDISARIIGILEAQIDEGIQLQRVEFVGPQIGAELTRKGGEALLYALIGILIYVWVRFEWRFSVGSIAALSHDVIITLGAFSLFQFSFDLTVLAAILAVIGYSLNDTIVVFDRVRENFRTVRKSDAVSIMNLSVNQMLSRTIMTSLTTLLVLVSLFIYGGEIIHGFAMALIIGVVIGTYSSIYVAGSAALLLGISKQDLMPVEKEGADHEAYRP